ncbi:MAG: cytochrome b5-like heme/steroid binding domain-containing protein [Minisyncoccia bacterium]
MLINTLKKLPIGILVFLMFAVTGITVAEVFHNKQESEKVGSGGVESERLETVKSQSDVELESNTIQSAQVNIPVSSVSKPKSDDDNDNSEIRQSSKHDGNDDGDDEDENEGDDDFRGSSPSQVVSVPTSIPSTTTFTLAQVATHNSSASCYSVVNGGVYDLTAWIGQHPGGSSAIKSMCGVDASDAFNGQHGGQARPASELTGFKIGVLVQ